MAIARPNQNAERRSSIMRRAFTLLELLVVIGVMIALVATTLPAFRAIQESNRTAGGVNALSAALNTARAIAIRDNRDTAVMFMFDIPRNVCSMQLLVLESVVDEAGNGMEGATVWVPAQGQAPMELPKGAVVYGCGYGATRESNANPDNMENWYCDLGLLYEGSRFDPWLIPRTDYRVYREDPTPAAIRLLDTFIVRFSPEGTVVTNAEEIGSLASGGDGFLELNSPGSDRYRQWTPDLENDGEEDVVVAEYQLRSVPLLVVVDVYELAQATGVKEPWRVQGADATFDRRDSNGNGEDDQYEVDRWIRDNTSVVAFNRYTGRIMRDIRR